MKERTKREPTFKFSVIMLLVVLAWAAVASIILVIPTVVMLMTALFLVATVCCLYLGMSFEEVMEAMVNGVKGSMEGIFFFFLIGGIISVWMLSGCLPALIYYGLNVLSADNFLPSVFFLTTLVSFCTGSSWTTMATIGVIGMGIGSVLGVPAAPCAGACVAGALAGDKICPISEGTNMAAASTGAPLYTHIRTALPTHVLAWIIAILMYLVVGLGYTSTGAQMEQAQNLQIQISEMFNVSPVFILPIIIILGASALQLPTIPTVAVGIVITIPFAMAQGFGIVDILNAIEGGVSIDIADPMLAEIVNRGGISSMFGTMSIVITALAFGGVMQGAGIFNVLTTAIFNKVRSQRMYPAIGVGVSTLVVWGTADDFPALTLVGPMLSEAYDNAGLDRSMLSRNIQEGAQTMNIICPYASTALFAVGAMGVPVIEYAPYAFFQWMCWALAIILPMFGLTIATKEKVAARGKKATTN